uniref:Dynamin related protein n=1 Tax=Chlamydomonas reinhardtii TaxID=3055 RepID=A2PZB9_CHLRE|nr:dynamin related protein [Chlamydomonas reinhardtii]
MRLASVHVVSHAQLPRDARTRHAQASLGQIHRLATITTRRPQVAARSVATPMQAESPARVLQQSQHGPMAATGYQRVSARLLGIANQLRDLGVDSDLKVPALVIAGDQSSGKSSVVEAIAGVPLPRSDGTCTRCPTEVRMRTHGAPGEGGSAVWQCRIKVVRNFNSTGKPLAPGEAHEKLFCTVTDKAHITACISAAQAVLLNPTVVGDSVAGGAERFVPLLSAAEPGGRAPEPSSAMRGLGDAAGYELQFTANKVVLEIVGAEADLTIIDLPGIIHSHPKDPSLIDVVKSLVKCYLAPAHHIIVMTLPAGMDAETQAILQFAREADPEGRRSIGIITKPDKIGPDERTEWGKLCNLVAGARAPTGVPAAAGGSRAAAAPNPHLQLGYYVVKNPGQEQLAAGISFEQARAAEERYFADHPLWASAMKANSLLSQRLGTNALRDGLSALLVDKIGEHMPEMRRSARAQLEKRQAELMRNLWRISDTLAQNALADIRGGSLDFYQELMRHYREYGERSIRSTPAFLVDTSLISALNSSDKGMHSSVDGGATATCELSLKELVSRIKDGPVVKSAQDAKAALEDERVKIQLRQLKFPEGYMTLVEVGQLRKRHLGRELPGFLPYSAMEALLSQFKGKHRDQATACLAAVEAEVHERARRVVGDQLGRYPRAKGAVGSALCSHVESLVQETAAELDKLLAREDGDVFTLNSYEYEVMRNEFLARLKRCYKQLKQPDDEAMPEVLDMLSELSRHGVHFADFDAAFMAQHTAVDDELYMAASCLAYFKVAFKRMQDAVPMAVRSTLLRRLGDPAALEAAVWRELLGAGAVAAEAVEDSYDSSAAKAAAAVAALQEDPQTASRRQHCVAMAQKLTEALQVLNTPAAQL